MKSVKTMFGIMALASMGLMANTGTANAAATFCVPGPNLELSVTDVTFRAANADDCYGVVGDNNLTISDINGWGGASNWTTKFGGGDFGFLTGAGFNTTINGVNYAFSGGAGSWSLNVTDPGPVGVFPQTLDIVFVIGDIIGDPNPNPWSAYLFNDETFTAAGANAGTWTWNVVNATPNYAYLAFRNGTPGSGSGQTSGQAAVPEPASLLLLGSGLGAAAWRARRKKANQNQ